MGIDVATYALPRLLTTRGTTVYHIIFIRNPILIKLGFTVAVKHTRDFHPPRFTALPAAPISYSVVPAGIAGTQKPRMATQAHPCDQDTGNPCRYDAASFS